MEFTPVRLQSTGWASQPADWSLTGVNSILESEIYLLAEQSGWASKNHVGRRERPEMNIFHNFWQKCIEIKLLLQFKKYISIFWSSFPSHILTSFHHSILPIFPIHLSSQLHKKCNSASLPISLNHPIYHPKKNCDWRR